MRRASSISAPLCALGAVLASPAMAQTAPDAAPPATAPAADQKPGFDDIIITATKKETNLQRTPIAITALSGDALSNQHVVSIGDIQGLVPGFQFSATAGFANFTLRGVGINLLDPLIEGSVAVHLNGVYVSRPQSQLAGFYDVANIEALRGPQGTLYGRNATAGSININTVMPTDTWTGNFSVTAGNYNQIRVEGGVGGPIAGDKLLLRIAGFSEDRSGYGKNVANGHDVDDFHARAIRATLLFKPSSDLTATIIGEYYRQKDASGGFHYFGPSNIGLPGQATTLPLYQRLGGFVSSNPLDEAADIDPLYYLETYAFTGKLEWKVADGLTLRSITAYRDQKNHIFATSAPGAGPTPEYLDYGEPAHQFSEEFQANFVRGPFDLTAGLYYFSERDEANPLTLVENAAEFGGSKTQLLNFFSFPGIIYTRSKAAFAQATVNVTDQLSLTAGIRYSHDFKRFEQHNNGISISQPYIPGQQFPLTGVRTESFEAWTPKFGIQYQITPRILLYATYAKGFKSGGFDPDDTSATGGVLKPEKLTDYEGGIKTTFFGGRGRLNLAAFYYDYKNLQLQTSNGTNFILVNAESAKLYGGEAEFSILATRNLQFDLTAAYLHTRYGNYLSVDTARRLLGVVNFKGNTLTNAPTFQGTAAAEYTFDLPRGGLALRGEVNYSSKVYLLPNNLFIGAQNAYAKVNLFLTYRDKAGWSFGPFVRNLTNKITKTEINISGAELNGSVSPPRTFGVQAGYKF